MTWHYYQAGLRFGGGGGGGGGDDDDDDDNDGDAVVVVQWRYMTTKHTKFIE